MSSTVFTTRRRVRKVFYGWWIVAAGFVLQALNGGLLFHSFTIYFLPLQAEFGWSRTLLSSGISITKVESAILGPIQGWAVDRFGSRRMVFLGILMFGGGFILFSRVESIFSFFIAFAILALGSSIGGFLPLSTTVTNWFARKRAMALGIAMAGMGAGGLIVPLLAWTVTTYGWRPTAFVSGFLVWLIGIPMALVLRHKPEQYGYLPDGEELSTGATSLHNLSVAQQLSGANSTLEYGFSVREALQTRSFWFLSVGHASALLVVSAVSVHQVPHMVQQVGMSLAGAGGVVAFGMVMTVVGQLGGGYAADRISKRALLIICMLGHAAGLLLLAYASNLVHLLLFASFHGLAWGARGPTIHSLRADYFGRRTFGTILGFTSLVLTIPMTSAPIFAGLMADIHGDYRMAFAILALLTALGSVFFLFAHKPVPRAFAGAEESAVGKQAAEDRGV